MATTKALPSMTPEQAKKLQAAAKSNGRHGKRDALMIRVAYVHGLRAVELTGLRWVDVNLDNRTLIVRRVKGSNDSHHSLTPDVVRALRKLPGDHTGYVFKSERDTPLSPNGFGKIVRRAGEEAGFEFVAHPHMLRHGCGFKLASEGKDLRSIQDYLGHVCVQNTVNYTQMSPARFKNFWTD
jgi:integrase